MGERITIDVSLGELRAIKHSIHTSWTKSEPDSSHEQMLWCLYERIRTTLEEEENKHEEICS